MENKAKKHCINNYGQTVLHIAATYDNTDLIRYFLKSGDGIDDTLLEKETNGEKQTPLHYAAKNGSLNSVRCLIREYKASIEAKDCQSKSFYSLCIH